MKPKSRSGNRQDEKTQPSWLHTPNEPTTSKPRPRRSARSLVLIALLALGLLVLSCDKSFGNDSVLSADALVELRATEVDSVISLIDSLEIDLWECRALASSDSAYSAERLARQERMYEEILQQYKDEQPNWLERTLKQPVVWLAIGMWVGVQAP